MLTRVAPWSGAKIEYDGSSADMARLARAGVPALVMYRMDGCGWCEKTLPEFVSACSMLPEDVECVVIEQKDIAPADRPDGYPYIFVQRRDGTRVGFAGMRTASDIADFARSNLSPPRLPPRWLGAMDAHHERVGADHYADEDIENPEQASPRVYGPPLFVPMHASSLRRGRWPAAHADWPPGQQRASAWPSRGQTTARPHARPSYGTRCGGGARGSARAMPWLASPWAGWTGW